MDANETLCKNPACRRPIAQVGGGHRRREYCDGACKMAAHRARWQVPHHQRCVAQVRTWGSFQEETTALLAELRSAGNAEYARRLAERGQERERPVHHVRIGFWSLHNFDQRDEEWRRTNLGELKLQALTPLQGASGREIVSPLGLNGKTGGRLTHDNSETTEQRLSDGLATQGVIFTDTDSALKEYPELFKKYFGTIIPPADNKFSALNSAVWSGGSFIYIPPGVHVDMPPQARRSGSKIFSRATVCERPITTADTSSSRTSGCRSDTCGLSPAPETPRAPPGCAAPPDCRARRAVRAPLHGDAASQARPARSLTGFCFDAAEFTFVTACSYAPPHFDADLSIAA